ncbi:S8 family peptidase [Lentzea tibetensis]|uniref:S8 family peptidase n=1 Tax=Lentzea tibetensis TaxID=2591470 RepID=UPI0016485DC8|nr:S8 family peptidase [Lentzea tibetensis]
MGSFHRRLAGAGAIAIALTAFATVPAFAAPAEAKSTAIDGSYIVVLKDGPQTADALAAKVDAKIEHRYSSALHGFAGKMTADAAAKLAADPAVKSVEQNQTVQLAADKQTPTPSWGLDRVDQRSKNPTNTYGYRGTASNVHAYIIDTGIKVDHPEFSGRATWNFNGVDTNNTDCNGHGTHVAGTVGGSSVGLAKAVKLHAVKVLNCSGGGDWAGVIAGIDWVTANAVKPAVANMSLGGSAIAAVDTAVRNSIASGVTYAVASMNFGLDACNYSPARVAEAITVNATDNQDKRASFSNYGACTDLFAPGVDITSSWNNNGYLTISGTSMATPHVVGAAALYLADNPAATPQQVSDHITNSATKNVVVDPVGSPNKLLHVNGEPDLVSGPDRLVPGDSLEADERITSPNGQHFLILQNDDNLVLYNNGTPKFATATNNQGSKLVFMQHDGNFVLYDENGRPLWATGTGGTSGTRIIVEDNGQLVLYGESYAKVWVSHTV